MIDVLQRLFRPRAAEAARSAMIEVLRESRVLIARPGNDFSWSSWEGPDDALKEIDGLIEMIQRGEKPERVAISVIFAPTGPMQELSLSSGWGREFCGVAERFDRAMRRF